MKFGQGPTLGGCCTAKPGYLPPATQPSVEMRPQLITLVCAGYEVLHPVNVRVAERGDYEGCERCIRAYSSVLTSNLTFMQQILAGDSWGPSLGAQSGVSFGLRSTNNFVMAYTKAPTRARRGA